MLNFPFQSHLIFACFTLLPTKRRRILYRKSSSSKKWHLASCERGRSGEKAFFRHSYQPSLFFTIFLHYFIWHFWWGVEIHKNWNVRGNKRLSLFDVSLLHTFAVSHNNIRTSWSRIDGCAIIQRNKSLRAFQFCVYVCFCGSTALFTSRAAERAQKTKQFMLFSVTVIWSHIVNSYILPIKIQAQVHIMQKCAENSECVVRTTRCYNVIPWELYSCSSSPLLACSQRSCINLRGWCAMTWLTDVISDSALKNKSDNIVHTFAVEQLTMLSECRNSSQSQFKSIEPITRMLT